MFKIYFIQTVQKMRQEKFISIITVVGTALSIMMIMVIIVADSIKNVDVAPEINRAKTLYVKNQMKTTKKPGRTNCGNLSYEVYKNYVVNLKTPQQITAVSPTATESLVSKDSEENLISLKKRGVDDIFWSVMSFSFIEGRPFTKEDFDSGLKKIVITESSAIKLFNTTAVVGKDIKVDFKSYTIVGVVKDVSEVFASAFSDIYIPYTSEAGFDKMYYTALLKCSDKSDFEQVYQELRLCEEDFNRQNTEWDLTIWGPYNHRTHLLNLSAMEAPDTKGYSKKMIFILSVLLLIPAVNLSSFSMSRIKKRTEEIGVRKAFGATKYTILIQVLYENMLTSLMGGILGLLLSYIVVSWFKEWLLGVDANTTIPLGALVSLSVFLGVAIACVLLSLLSASMPAYKASRMMIVNSLNKNNTQS